MIARIPVGHNPRGLALSGDGRRLFVANRLDDTISVIDTRANRVASTIALAGPKTVSALRRGEQTFYSARYSFQGQISCSSCHIDSTFDGLQWDLEPDGFGIDIVDNKMLEDIKDTAPYKWNGGNPNLPTECGPRTEKYFWRSENYDDLHTDRSGSLHSQPACPAQPLAPARQRNDAGAGTRQGDLRAHSRQVRQADSARTTAAPIATADPREPTRSYSTWARASPLTMPGC